MAASAFKGGLVGAAPGRIRKAFCDVNGLISHQYHIQNQPSAPASEQRMPQIQILSLHVQRHPVGQARIDIKPDTRDELAHLQ